MENNLSVEQMAGYHHSCMEKWFVGILSSNFEFRILSLQY